MNERELIEGGGDPAGLGLPAYDWDRLADYVGGALDGTPEAADVARRIAEDPVWRRAHASLTEATAAVTADLGEWGRPAAPMPEDVADRIGAALAAHGETATRTPPPRLSERRGLSVVPDMPDMPGEATERTGPATARAARRWVRWAKPLAVAAGLLAVLGLGVELLPRLSNNGGSTSDLGVQSAPGSATREDSGAVGGSVVPLSNLPVRLLTASGTDYRRDTVSGATRSILEFSASGRPGGTRHTAPAGPEQPVAPATKPEALDAKADPTLRRLTNAAALSACVDAVVREHKRAATAIELLDFAAYEGSPALVMVFTDAAGERWVWVTGPTCGVPGAGADTRHSARVG